MLAQMTQNKDRIIMQNFDQWLLWIALMMLGLSLVMVYSASIASAEAKSALGNQSTYYLLRQGLYIVLGITAGAVCFQIPLNNWQKMAPFLFLLGVFLLVLVLIVGRSINGSQRWLPLGIVNLQPSEFVKLFTAMYVADYAIRKSDQMDSIVKGFLPMVVVMTLIGFLLLKEPDFGALAVIATIAMSVLWLAGINVRIFIGLMIAMPVAFQQLILNVDYRRARLEVLSNPFLDPYDKGYQLTHSLIAFGRGEWTGVGLGGSVEKLLYLPEAHTDFILAVIAEELGFLGVALVIGLFACLLIRAFGIAKEAVANERYFSALLAQGIGVWIGVQAIINIGVNMGALPTKGITLPLLSYGGSGILANCIAIAILLRIDYENRRMLKGLPV